MKNFTRTCLYVVASAALAATCLAQGKRTRPAKREPPPRRVTQAVVIAPTMPNPPEIREVGRATLTYFPGQDFTSVSVTLPGAYRQGKVSADLIFNAAFKGREFAKVEETRGEVEWIFTSGWDIFTDATRLTVTVDGAPRSFEVQRDLSRPDIRVGKMDSAAFKRIANSKSARLSLGRVAFDLTGEQRGTMRDLLNVFETTEKR
jgi:hypothetical protein